MVISAFADTAGLAFADMDYHFGVFALTHSAPPYIAETFAVDPQAPFEELLGIHAFAHLYLMREAEQLALESVLD